MEPGRDGDRVVTSRKGVGRFVMTGKGRASHAGVRHEDGRSAILEMARQIARIEGKTDYKRGITCNVGLINAGTGVNVRAAECTPQSVLRAPAGDGGVRLVSRREALADVLGLFDLVEDGDRKVLAADGAAALGVLDQVIEAEAELSGALAGLDRGGG